MENELMEETVEVVEDTVETKELEEVTVVEESTEESVVAENADETPEESFEEQEVIETTEEPAEADNADEVVETHSAHFAIGSMNFEVSLDEIQYALSTLVNETYGEADNTYYSTIVYADSKSVVMVDCWTNKAFKQTYKVRNGSYSLSGDRIPVKSCWLTADEESQLDQMRSKYSAISAELDNYKKSEMFGSSDYAGIADSDEFKALMEESKDMSFEVTKQKCDAMLLDFAKSGKLGFSAQPEKKVGKVNLPKVNKRKKNYGNLFDGI